MKTKIEDFTSLGSRELMETNGGGFAYDVGRILRFIGLSGASALHLPYAIADWEVNSILNDLENG